MNDSPAPLSAVLPHPPSAGKAKLFGILGICSHLLCLLGAPFAVLFGILALVRHGRAKREHAEYPKACARPYATGFVTGLVALEAVQEYTGPEVTSPCPAVVIRGSLRRGATSALVTRVVPLN
jgi:hypothetical protein